MVGALGTVRVWGVRARVAFWFAAIALGLSVTLGLATFLTVRQVLMTELETSALDQALVNSQLVTRTIRSGLADEAQLLVSLRPPVRSRPFLLRDSEWFSASLQIRPDDIPGGLVQTALDGVVARQLFLIRGSPFLAVAVPLEEGRSSYFEVFGLEGLIGTLGALRWTLLVAGSVTTLAGAGLGWWAARRALRPLQRVTGVAEEIASGNLDSRLDETLDPDLARISASFNRMADSLALRIEREERFASDVAHELRSPLTTLATALSVVDGRRHELSAESQEALGLVVDEVQRFQRMVQDLIEMARHDAGTITVDIKMFQAAKLVRTTLRRLGRSDLLDVEPGLVGMEVRIDQRRFERILANLIENADHHGGGATAVRMESGVGVARVVVEDCGPGIPYEDRERVFERFARGGQSKRRGSGEGVGLGLALAREYALVQGARVVVEDRRGGGARVVFEIPVVDMG
jgi:signal transduction histidine kinase